MRAYITIILLLTLGACRIIVDRTSDQEANTPKSKRERRDRSDSSDSGSCCG